MLVKDCFGSGILVCVLSSWTVTKAVFAPTKSKDGRGKINWVNLHIVEEGGIYGVGM